MSMNELSLSAASTTVVDSGSSVYSPLNDLDKETAPRVTPRRAKRSLLGGAPSEAWRDLRAAQWGKCGLWLLYVFWLALLVFGLVYFGRFSVVDTRLVSACQPDASFSPIGEKFNYWSSSAFFQISLSGGEFSFTDVKIIDIAVQLVLGRGGQALLAFISWRAFRNFLTVKMTENPTTFATFFVVFLQPEPTLMSTYRLIREFSIHRRPGSIATAIFIPLTVIFTLVFPTAVNSMTGYMTVNDPYVEDRNGRMIPFSDFDRVAYIIHDGKRINETDDLIIPFHSADPATPEYFVGNNQCGGASPADGCDLLRAASRYTEEYGFFGLTDEETTWMDDVKLEPPSLNVSAFYFEYFSDYYGNKWKDPRGNPHYPFCFPENTTYVTAGELYHLPYAKEHGKCQPASESYKWGVSFAQTYIMVIVLLIWSLGTSIMWYKGHRRLPIVDQPEVPNGWRAVVELARAMEAEFRSAGVDVTAVTDDHAKRVVRKKLRGGSVSFRQHQLSRGEGNLGPAAWAWLKREKWWAVWSVGPIASAFGVLFCDSYIASTSFMTVMGTVLLSIGAGTTVAVLLGTTLRSRVFILSVFLLAVGLPICIFVGVLFASSAY